MRGCRFLVCVVLALLAAATAGSGGLAHAADPTDAPALLRRGIALQREGSWSASIAALEKARAATLAPAERVECAFYLGAAYLAIGSEGAARRELAAVLQAQPSFEPPPYTSPKVASLLGEVARELGQAPSLEARPPRRLAASDHVGSGVELSFEPRRAKAPIYGVVRFRMRGDARWDELALQHRTNDADSPLVAEVRPRTAGVLEYYADALSAAGALRAGAVGAPLELPLASIDPPRKRGPAPKGTSKLVWLAVPLGVVLGASVGVGLYFGLRSR